MRVSLNDCAFLPPLKNCTSGSVITRSEGRQRATNREGQSFLGLLSPFQSQPASLKTQITALGATNADPASGRFSLPLIIGRCSPLDTRGRHAIKVHLFSTNFRRMYLKSQNSPYCKQISYQTNCSVIDKTCKQLVLLSKWKSVCLC